MAIEPKQSSVNICLAESSNIGPASNPLTVNEPREKEMNSRKTASRWPQNRLFLSAFLFVLCLNFLGIDTKANLTGETELSVIPSCAPDSCPGCGSESNRDVSRVEAEFTQISTFSVQVKVDVDFCGHAHAGAQRNRTIGIVIKKNGQLFQTLQKKNVGAAVSGITYSWPFIVPLAQCEPGVVYTIEPYGQYNNYPHCCLLYGNTLSVTRDSTPNTVTSVVWSDPNEDGIGEIKIDYQFNETTPSNARTMQYCLDSGTGKTCFPADSSITNQNSGKWTIPIDFSCIGGPIQVEAEMIIYLESSLGAIVCDDYSQKSFELKNELNLVSVELDDDGMFNASATWNLDSGRTNKYLFIEYQNPGAEWQTLILQDMVEEGYGKSGTVNWTTDGACIIQDGAKVRARIAGIDDCAFSLTSDEIGLLVDYTPDIAISYFIDPIDGKGMVFVNFDFVGTNHSSQRSLEFSLDDIPVEQAPLSVLEQRSGTWEFPFASGCGTDSSLIQATATTCGNFSDTKRQLVLLEPAEPTVGIEYVPDEVDGTGTVEITFDFVGTNHSSERTLEFFLDDVKVDVAPLSVLEQESGIWTIPFSSGCGSEESQIKAVATTCGILSNFDEKSVLLSPGTPTVEIELVTGQAVEDAVVKITYGFPGTTSPSQRVVNYYRNNFLEQTFSDLLEESGEIEIPAGFLCAFEISAEAIVCGNPDLATVDQIESSDPGTVTLLPKTESIEDNGVINYSYSITYNFSDSFSPEDMSIELFASTGDENDPWTKIKTYGDADINDTGEGTIQDTYSRPCLQESMFIFKAVNTCGVEHTGTLDNPVGRPNVSVTAQHTHDRTVFDIHVTGNFGYSSQVPGVGSRVLIVDWISPGGLQKEAVPMDSAFCNLSGNTIDCQLLGVTKPSWAHAVEVTVVNCRDRDKKFAFLKDFEKACESEFGDPIQARNGNMYFEREDQIPGANAFGWVRRYDSLSDEPGAFGPGWRSPFDANLVAVDELVYVNTETNTKFLFENVDGSFVQLLPKGSQLGTQLTFDGTSYHLMSPSNSKIRSFSSCGADYRMTAMRIPGSGQHVTIGYDCVTGAAISVTDFGFGRWAWTVETDTTSRQVTRILLDGSSWSWEFAYPNGSLLGSVSSFDGTSGELVEEYLYEDANLPNEITALMDGQGSLISQYSYNATGQAISCVGPRGGYVSATYDFFPNTSGIVETRAISSTGLETVYKQVLAAGRVRTIAIEGGCPSCGANDAVFAYDSFGHRIAEQNSRGFVTLYEFDSQDRVTRSFEHYQASSCVLDIEGDCQLIDPLAFQSLAADTANFVPTPEGFVRAYTYGDPNWPNRATRVTQPSLSGSGRISAQEYTYDPVTGMKLVDRSIGWSDQGNGWEEFTRETSQFLVADSNGIDCNDWDICSVGDGTIDWTQAQPMGFLKLVDGPRNDVADIMEFVYYPVHNSVSEQWRGRLAATRNALGHTTIFSDYDVFGNAQKVVDPNGVVSETSYDRYNRQTGQVLKAIVGCDTSLDPMCEHDLITQNFYALGGGPVTMSINPNGSVSTMENDEFGRRSAVSRGPSPLSMSERKEWTFDIGNGKVASVQIQAPRVTNLPDPPNQPPGVGGPPAGKGQGVGSGPVVNSWETLQANYFEYDEYGRMTRKYFLDRDNDDSNDPFIEYTYNAVGNIQTIKDENHPTPNVNIFYDSANRKKRVETLLDGNWITTLTTRNLAGAVESLTDANGNTTEFVFDDFGRSLSEDSPVSGTIEYRYDASGLPTFKIDALGATTERTFDELGRLLTETVYKDGDPVLNPDTIFTYDEDASGFGKGRLTTQVDPAGTKVYTYDRRGLRLSTEVDFSNVGSSFILFGLPGRTYLVRQQYDALGAETSLERPDVHRTVTFNDWAGRPLSKTLEFMDGYGATSIISGAQYLPFGPLAKLTYGNGWVEEREYDGRYLIEGLTVKSAGKAMTDLAYSQDAMGNITGMADRTTAAAGTNFGAGQSGRSFVYDDLGRLVEAHAFDKNQAPVLWQDATFTLDPVGNRLEKTIGSPTGPRTVTYDYLFDGSANTGMLNSWSDGSATRTYTYDGAGKITHDSVMRHDYDVRGRMVGFKSNANGLGLGPSKFDAFGNRWARINYQERDSKGRQLGITSIWVDGRIVQERTMHEIDFICPFNRPCPPGPFYGEDVESRIFFGGMPVATYRFGRGSEDLSFLLNDHVGKAYAKGDANGTLNWRAEYTPFGQVYQLTVGADVTDQSFRFPGQELYDKVLAADPFITQLYFNQHRVFDPETGRYTQPDPIGLNGGLNLYTYVNNNPVNLFDRNGLEVEGRSFLDFLKWLGGGGMAEDLAANDTGNYWSLGAGIGLTPAGAEIDIVLVQLPGKCKCQLYLVPGAGALQGAGAGLTYGSGQIWGSEEFTEFGVSINPGATFNISSKNGRPISAGGEMTIDLGAAPELGGSAGTQIGTPNATLFQAKLFFDLNIPIGPRLPCSQYNDAGFWENMGTFLSETGFLP